MKPSLLIKECEKLIKTFNPKKMTLDSHSDEVLGDCESPDANPSCVFIKQVFYGCVTNKAALKVRMLPHSYLHFILIRANRILIRTLLHFIHRYWS